VQSIPSALRLAAARWIRGIVRGVPPEECTRLAKKAVEAREAKKHARKKDQGDVPP
jgi:hypothetical protein